MAQGGIPRSRVALVAAVAAGVAVESIALLTTVPIAVVLPLAIAVAVGVWFVVRRGWSSNTTAILTSEDAAVSSSSDVTANES